MLIIRSDDRRALADLPMTTDQMVLSCSDDLWSPGTCPKRRPGNGIGSAHPQWPDWCGAVGFVTARRPDRRGGRHQTVTLCSTSDALLDQLTEQARGHLAARTR
jgi:hypothetical protein